MSPTCDFWWLTSDRMLADAEYFNNRISKLEGAGDLGSHIVGTVQSKTIVGDLKQPESVSSAKEYTPPEKTAERTTSNANGE